MRFNQVSDIIPDGLSEAYGREMEANNPATYKEWVAGLMNDKAILDHVIPIVLQEKEQMESRIKSIVESVEKKQADLMKVAAIYRYNQR